MEAREEAMARLPQVRECRILIVDDEPANVTLLRRVLGGAGFENLESTNDSRETLRLVETFDPDCILLDLLMPHMDGYAVMHALASLLPPDDFLPILVVTADITAEAKERALSGGAKDFLNKPFDPVEVVLRVRNLLETRLLYRQLKSEKGLLEQRVTERTASLSHSLELLRRSDRQRRELLVRLIEAQEHERERLAAEIHDDAIQVMAAVAIRVQSLRWHLRESDDVVDQLEETVDQAIARLRHLTSELRPPLLDREGLASALRVQLEDVAGETSLGWELDNRLVSEPSVPARLVLYRIAQEAVANVRKHAQASHLDLVLQPRDAGTMVTVSDDGIGISQDADGRATPQSGLAAMKERAEISGGWWQIESAAGNGTTVEFWVPDDAGLGLPYTAPGTVAP